MLPAAAYAQQQQMTGFGTIAATTASVQVSTMTLGPQSNTWPPSPKTVYVMNAAGSAGLLYVCPLGGTCSATTGIPISPGAAYGFAGPASTMTLVAASTATVWVQF
jgi:hypothetical protein